MEICDFSYRGERLSSYGYIMCDFDGISSAAPVASDSQKIFISMPMLNGSRFPFLYYTYNEAVVIQIDICKADDSDLVITPSEAARIKRWLNAPYPEKFRLIDADYDDYFWMGSFNVSEIKTGVDTVGLRLTLTTTAPFAYKDRVTISGSVAAGGTVKINDFSDEEGYIYPDIELNISTAGDLTITNSSDDRKTIMKNCQKDETLIFTQSLQILSSSTTHDVYGDFNYHFLRLNNKYLNTVNTLTFSLPCSYTISYYPIAKVVFA